MAGEIPQRIDSNYSTPSEAPLSSIPAVVSYNSQRMARQGRKNTKPELALRKELHRRGMRYRVDAAIPGMSRRRADILFPKKRIAVFVDGCFWHSCPLHGAVPKTNSEWWSQKLQANVARDVDTTLRLQSTGWLVLRFWEHEDSSKAADAVEAAVRLKQS